MSFRPRQRVATKQLGSKVGLDPFVLLCRAHGLPDVQTEVVFAPPRQFRADYVLRHHDGRYRPVIVEREGGLFAKGRAGMAHAMPTSIKRDMERSNLAQLQGFLYLRYTPEQLEHEAIEDLKKIFHANGLPAQARRP